MLRLFFKNISRKQILLKNSSWIVISNVLSKLFKLVLLFFTTRYLGPEKYGYFGYIVAILVLIFNFSSLGLESYILREFQNEKVNKQSLSSTTFFIKGTMVILIGIVLSLFCRNFIEPTLKAPFYVFLLMFMIDNIKSSIGLISIGKHHFERPAIALIIETLFTTIFGIFALLKFGTLLTFSYAYLLASCLSFCAMLFLEKNNLPTISTVEIHKVKEYILKGMPFLLTSIIYKLLTTTDIMMIKEFLGPKEVGFYSAATKIPEFALLFVSIVISALYPMLCKYADDPAKFRHLLSKSLQFIGLFVLPVIVGVVVLYEQVVELLFGADFNQAASYLPYVVWYIPLSALIGIFNSALLALSLEKRNMVISSISVILNLTLNVMGVLLLGIKGIIFATIFSQIIDLLLTYNCVAKNSQFRFIERDQLWKWGVSVLLMGLLINVTKNNNVTVYFTVIMGALSYVGILILLKEKHCIEIISLAKKAMANKQR